MGYKTGERFKIIAKKLFDDSIGDLAQALEMKPGSFSKYTSGKTMPGGNLLRRLVEMGINLNWFLEGIGPMLYSELDRNSELTQLENEGLEKINKRIKWVRLNYKKTVSEMANVMSVSATRQVNIEKGKRELWPEYIDRLHKNFPDIREPWLQDGEEPKLKSSPTKQVQSVNKDSNEEEIANSLAALENRAQSPAEHALLKEVKNFANLLESPNLSPQVKQTLLQLLNMSIDQELERRQRAQPQPSAD